MLATRIIPLLLHRSGLLVKGIQFHSWRTAGHALQAARIHQARGVDELLVLDVGATPEGITTDAQTLRQITEECFMPVTAGGGVRSIYDVKALLWNGADKVAIGAAIWRTPGIIRACSSVYGSQAIVAVIETEHERCYIQNSGASNIDPLDMAMTLEREGAGELLLMSRDRDGTLEGYDLVTLERVAKAVNVPVIAAGGAGTYEHMLQAVRAGASAVAAGALFMWTDQTPRGAAEYLRWNNIEVRIP
jgi:imidazole glycerol-phosphate synthase subunit HisF